jgi:hypothetical protein
MSIPRLIQQWPVQIKKKSAIVIDGVTQYKNSQRWKFKGIFTFIFTEEDRRPIKLVMLHTLLVKIPHQTFHSN